MKICVFGAASNEIDHMYIQRVEELCKALGERGHELVFGAGAKRAYGSRGARDEGRRRKDNGSYP